MMLAACGYRINAPPLNALIPSGLPPHPLSPPASEQSAGWGLCWAACTRGALATLSMSPAFSATRKLVGWHL